MVKLLDSLVVHGLDLVPSALRYGLRLTRCSVCSQEEFLREGSEPLERKAARERQREHGDTAPGRKRNTSGKLPEVLGDSRDKRAAAVLALRVERRSQ